MNIPSIDLPRIVVIGCGFAGLKFTKKIDSSRYQIVLIDKNNYHTFQPLLYQVATSGLEPDSIVYPIRKIFKGKKNFYFRMAETTSINTNAKKIETTIGIIEYDILVVATGAVTNFFGNTSIEKYSMPMKALVESLDLRSRILQNFEEALNTSDIEERESLMNFTIVGAGPTGIELAGALAELRSHILPKDYPDLDIRRMQINIIEANTRVLAAMNEASSHKTANYLKKRGVNVWLDTLVKDYDGSTITTNKDSFKTKTVIWAAGIKGYHPKGLSIKNAAANRIPVDEYSQIIGEEDIYALGDVAHMVSKNNPKSYPMLGSVAEQQGGHLAKNLNAISKRKNKKPFQYKDRGTMATIGRNKAVVELPFVKFGGFFGWLTWMFVHLMLLVDFRSKLVVFTNWMWSYFLYDKGTRLIVRKYHRKTK